jgi:hypothetical protein
VRFPLRNSILLEMRLNMWLILSKFINVFGGSGVKLNIIIHKQIKPLILILVALVLVVFCVFIFPESKLYEQ